MKVVYHPAVQRDVSGILRHYDSISSRLGDEFWRELNQHMDAAAANPKRFPQVGESRRRVNLKKFPYHFLFRETVDGIRIIVVRHHKQHPKLGTKRE